VTDFIEWRYPEDGCYARAHIMGRIVHRLYPAAWRGKVWAFAPTESEMHTVVHLPKGDVQVGWTWHVTPILKVKDPDRGYRLMVLDPGLFAGPVSRSTWLSRLNGVGHWNVTPWGQPLAGVPGTGYSPFGDPPLMDLFSSYRMARYHDYALAEGRY
jgi:hypothetical protein